jgi:hypothetical protein
MDGGFWIAVSLTATPGQYPSRADCTGYCGGGPQVSDQLIAP